MRPTQVAEATKLLYAKRRPGFIWGPPGAGKSDVMRQVAEEEKLGLIDIRLSMLDPTDLKGFPIADREKNVMRWLTADFLPHDPKWKGIIFFDEANSAPKTVEAPMYQLSLDRRLGDYVLPEGAHIMMAGNRESDRAIANRMSSALQNRLIHIDYEVHLDDWITWAIQKGKIMTELTGFMRFRPALLHKFNPDSKAWPSPRSWAFVSQIIHSGISRDTELELIKGAVGDGPASEFMAYLNVYRDLPSMDRILANPTKERIPEGADSCYAITTSLAEHTTKETFGKMMQYVTRMSMEYQVVFIRDAVRQQAPVENTKEFIKWCSDNSDVLAG